MEVDASTPVIATTIESTPTMASTSSNKKINGTGSRTKGAATTHRKNYSGRYNNAHNNSSNMQRYQTNAYGGFAYGSQMVYEMDPQMREYYNHMAVQQIELLYSIDCLCVDTYFRSFMDEAGYSPLALVASYPNVAYYGATIVDLMDKISGKEDSPLEVDRENETIRLKEGWEKWLMPNNFGGMGAPRYLLPQYAQMNDGSRQGHIQGKNSRNNRNSTTVGSNSSSSISPTTVAMHEESSSCRDSTSGESRDSDDVMMLIQTPEGSVAGGDPHMDLLEQMLQRDVDEKKKQLRREEEDREQQKQNADRLCPAPVVVISKSPTSVAGLGWAGVLKMNLNAPPLASADKAPSIHVKKTTKPIARPVPAAAPVTPAPVVAPAAVDAISAATTAPVAVAAPVAAPAPTVISGKPSYAAMLAMAAKGSTTDAVTAAK